MMHEKKKKERNKHQMHQAPPFFNFVMWREHNQYHVNVNIPLILETVALQLTEMLSSYPTTPSQPYPFLC